MTTDQRDLRALLAVEWAGRGRINAADAIRAALDEIGRLTAERDAVIALNILADYEGGFLVFADQACEEYTKTFPEAVNAVRKAAGLAADPAKGPTP